MELPNLGEHCNQPECKQLDFLPVPCALCNLIFCKDHSLPYNHNCDKQTDNVVTTKITAESFKCSYDGCKESTVVEMLCTKCHKHFCLSHRHHECQEIVKKEIPQWRVNKEQFKKAKAETDKQVDKKLQAAKKGTPANRALANKIILMKIKGKSFGDNKVPVVDRIFFSVHSPCSVREGNRALFVSKTWTVGKAIDFFAKKLKVENSNNVPTAPKLRLFVKESGELVTHCMDDVLENLMKDQVILDGDTLILEFVDPGIVDRCEAVSIDPEKYKEV